MQELALEWQQAPEPELGPIVSYDFLTGWPLAAVVAGLVKSPSWRLSFVLGVADGWPVDARVLACLLEAE